jgi:hypothetical protein
MWALDAVMLHYLRHCPTQNALWILHSLIWPANILEFPAHCFTVLGGPVPECNPCSSLQNHKITVFPTVDSHHKWNWQNQTQRHSWSYITIFRFQNALLKQKCTREIEFLGMCGWKAIIIPQQFYLQLSISSSARKFIETQAHWIHGIWRSWSSPPCTIHIFKIAAPLCSENSYSSTETH